jgi:hypothetical protein
MFNPEVASIWDVADGFFGETDFNDQFVVLLASFCGRRQGGRALHTLLESLILAQDERWRRA